MPTLKLDLNEPPIWIFEDVSLCQDHKKLGRYCQAHYDRLIHSALDPFIIRVYIVEWTTLVLHIPRNGKAKSLGTITRGIQFDANFLAYNNLCYAFGFLQYAGVTIENLTNSSTVMGKILGTDMISTMIWLYENRNPMIGIKWPFTFQI